MSGCVERFHQHVSPMTGSIELGPIKPHFIPYSKIEMPNFIAHNDQLKISSNQHNKEMMTTILPFQTKTPIQLTPLWEHVVRTQQFPSEVDKQLTFDEISERLRDPEWEVRQHALRVLIDVLPTLKNNDDVDDFMVPVVPELVNNLGNLAPAVRKGALDALRVYLISSQKPDDIVNNILEASLIHHDIKDNIKTSITTGVILSTPTLLFPTLSNDTNLTRKTLKLSINYLANNLIQVKHQESALKSLVKIRDIIGNDEFIKLLDECDPKYKIDFEIICKDYDINDKLMKKKKRKKKIKKKKINSIEINEDNNNNNNNFDVVDVVDVIDDENNKANENSTIPPSRVVLETEIKFNSETAIMMTILEEKNTDSDDERQNNDDNDDEREEEEEEEEEDYFSIDKLQSEFNEEYKLKTSEIEKQNEWIERRKTPRRVHFGGEIVKLRTPDSDDSDVIHQTKIPLPIIPVTKMPFHKSRVTSINQRFKINQRRSRSASNSPKRQYYIYDANLSPKKSILTKTNDYDYFNNHHMNRRKSKSLEDERFFNGEIDENYNLKKNDRSWSFEIFQDTDDDDNIDELIELNTNKYNKIKKKKKLKSAGKITTTIAEIHNESIKSDDEKTNDDVNNDKKNYLKVPQIIIEKDKLNSNNIFNKDDKNFENLSKRPNTTPGLIETIDTSFDNEIKKNKYIKRSQSSLSRKPNYEAFPKKERNYIYMELSSPAKVKSSHQVLPSDKEIIENNEKLSNNTEQIDEIKKNENNDVKIETSIVVNDNSVVKKINENDDVDDSGESRNNSSDSGPKIHEENWEELGLVNQEILDDLHNKDDWRARVRALERIASALRTSSSLIAIEPRLGSLLQTVLGGERSCKVAAAGMSVARVVIAGVTEEALRRRLPQIAWGLTRQGGPNAAQLSRIVMLRLRPTLFFEQLLQPHCIDARNAKTRENALQLLIFSLVTFPSTEFKVENVANKVALMVGDKRRRVRQAALDTLAVLAQIYEPEETLQAGNRAAKKLKENNNMMAAIRARISRKSLPMVSADGLVVYGLQISPKLQITTGPDVDWILAGTGSVSPGTGRARGQIISTTNKIETINNNNNKLLPSGRRSAPPKPNFVALGVGLVANKNDNSSSSWQLVLSTDQEVNKLSLGNEEKYHNDSPISTEKNSAKLLFDLSHNNIDKIIDADDKLNSEKDIIMKQRKTEENFHRRMDEIYGEKSHGRLESRIPVPQYRDKEIRHNTAYHRRKKDDDVYQATSSAPQTSSGQRHENDNVNDIEIARRYRGDRLRQSSRPVSQERIKFEQQRDSSTPDIMIDNQRRKSVVQSIFSDNYHENLSPSRIDSRRNSVISQRNNSASILQKNSRSRRLSNAQLIQGEKNNIDDDEENLNEINKRHVSAQANSYRIQNLSDQSTQCSGCDQVPFQISNSLSNCSVDNQSIQDNQSSPIQNDNDDIIIPRRNSFSEKSFDIITGESNPSRHNSIDQIPQSVLSSDSIDLEKDTSSDDLQYKIIDKHEIEQPDSSSSVVSNETISVESINRIIENNLQNNNEIKTYEFDEHDHPDASLIYDENKYSNNVQDDIESRMIDSICPDEKIQFKKNDIIIKDQDNTSETRSSSDVNSVSIFSTSRPHSRANSQYNDLTYQKIDDDDNNNNNNNNNNHHHHHENNEETSSVLSASHENNFDAISIVTNKSFTELPDNLDIDSLIVGKTYRSIQSSSNDNITTSKILETDVNKIIQSKVPRIKVKPRIGTNKVSPISQINHHHVDNKIPGKSKTAILQCFSQLESTEWEVTIKGLKALSIITRQKPEQLETCPPGTLGRLLGRHVKNLRSQVARTACLAAGDVFESQTRCLDQELDDIAGPLLQRTADTNKFLRADSNAALDRMIEHLSPQKTIAVIVYRGASHQNAIVRAASARLLLSIVDRVGPDIVMMLPRDIRDKYLSASAKLIMDGNLDARNHAKKMFKKLSRWDGFRRALKDSVPETTLRHIDKTLRSL